MSAAFDIIDPENNPFIQPSWINQGCKLTAGRQTELAPLFGLTKGQIMQGDPNKRRYSACVAIRRGFAELRDNILVPTGKWENRHHYDALGNPKSGVAGPVPGKTGATAPQRKPTPPVASAPVDKQPGPAKGAPPSISALRDEMERRCIRLVELAHRDDVPMVAVERDHIIQYIEHKRFPQKPDNTIQVMKEFVSSALSINQPPHRIRNVMKRILGDIPLANTIPLCLNKLYDFPAFLDDRHWTPDALAALLEGLDANPNDALRADIRHTLIALAHTMDEALKHGVQPFYQIVEAAANKGPEQTWRFMQRFTVPIPGVGPGLMADFLKNIGFPQFVKIDQRLKKEFPKLISGVPPDPKSMFIFAIELCRQLDMTPFLFDHILYQWGSRDIEKYLK